MKKTIGEILKDGMESGAAHLAAGLEHTSKAFGTVVMESVYGPGEKTGDEQSFNQKLEAAKEAIGKDGLEEIAADQKACAEWSKGIPAPAPEHEQEQGLER